MTTSGTFIISYNFVTIWRDRCGCSSFVPPSVSGFFRRGLFSCPGPELMYVSYLSLLPQTCARIIIIIIIFQIYIYFYLRGKSLTMQTLTEISLNNLRSADFQRRKLCIKKYLRYRQNKKREAGGREIMTQDIPARWCAIWLSV